MKNYFLVVFLVFASIAISAQSLSGKHHIKYVEVNTVQSDYGVSFLDDDLVFTSPIDENKKYSQQELYVGKIGDEGEIIDKKPIGGLPKSKISRESLTFSKDGKTVYFSAKKYRKRKNSRDKYQLYKATVNDNGDWTNPERLPFNSKRFNTEQPSLSSDGKKLYFVSDRNPSYGKDIFVVDINDDGSYGEPVNLGTTVNTKGDEVTPHITKDNILYFSSNGREDTIGGLDVYASEVFDTSISEPLHLESPINSLNDDFAYILNIKNDGGYFASNRLQGQDNNDIYAFKIEEQKPEKCVQQIAGVVRDKETNNILNDAAITLFDEDGNQIEQAVTNNNGEYSFTLDCNQTYTLVASTIHHKKEEHIINTANYRNAPALEANKFLIRKSETAIAATPTSDDNKVVDTKEKATETTTVLDDEEALAPVYFGFDKSNITKESSKELDRVAEIMKQNKSIKLEVSAFTDARGSKAYNLALSNRRAKSTVDYLVSKGIDRTRIEGKGYGESKMVNKCVDGVKCSETAHAKNRRTELNFISDAQTLNTPKTIKKESSETNKLLKKKSSSYAKIGNNYNLVEEIASLTRIINTV